MEKKCYEIIINGESYGLYEGNNIDEAIEAQAQDASYESVADLVVTLNMTPEEYRATISSREISFKFLEETFTMELFGLNMEFSFFDVYRDGEFLGTWDHQVVRGFTIHDMRSIISGIEYSRSKDVRFINFHPRDPRKQAA